MSHSRGDKVKLVVSRVPQLHTEHPRERLGPQPVRLEYLGDLKPNVVLSSDLKEPRDNPCRNAGSPVPLEDFDCGKGDDRFMKLAANAVDANVDFALVRQEPLAAERPRSLLCDRLKHGIHIGRVAGRGVRVGQRKRETKGGECVTTHESRVTTHW